MEAAGLELDSVNRWGEKGLGESAPAGGAESGPLGAHSGPIDPDLALLIDAWPRLPEAVRRHIVAMVEAARRE